MPPLANPGFAALMDADEWEVVQSKRSKKPVAQAVAAPGRATPVPTAAAGGVWAVVLTHGASERCHHHAGTGCACVQIAALLRCSLMARRGWCTGMATSPTELPSSTTLETCGMGMGCRGLSGTTGPRSAARVVAGAGIGCALHRAFELLRGAPSAACHHLLHSRLCPDA